MIKIVKRIIFISCLFASTGCEHYYHIFLVNNSDHNQSISVLNYYNVKVDSLKFFSASEKPTTHNYNKANLYRNTSAQDSFYRFVIGSNETTLLQPITFGTYVKAVIINADTVYFTDSKGYINKKFMHKWTDRYIYTIH